MAVLIAVKLEDTAARNSFIIKLHRGLITMQLPLSYACLLCLAARWSLDDADIESSADNAVLCKSDVVNMLELNVSKRRHLLSTVPPSSLTSNKCYMLFFYFTLNLDSYIIPCFDFLGCRYA